MDKLIETPNPSDPLSLSLEKLPYSAPEVVFIPTNMEDSLTSCGQTTDGCKKKNKDF